MCRAEIYRIRCSAQTSDGRRSLNVCFLGPRPSSVAQEEASPRGMAEMETDVVWRGDPPPVSAAAIKRCLLREMPAASGAHPGKWFQKLGPRRRLVVLPER
ncbi:unnamed protein product [Lota lota]